MSRSYRKVPGGKDRNPWAKRQANKRVRKRWDIDNGKAYKRLYESWNISDWNGLLFSPERKTSAVERYGEKTYQLWNK